MIESVVPSAAFVKDSILVDFCEPLYSDEKRLFRLGSGAFRLLSMDFVEHCFESFLESLVFGALVEFADEVAAYFEGVVSEIKGGAAQILRTTLVSVYRQKSLGDNIPCYQHDL